MRQLGFTDRGSDRGLRVSRGRKITDDGLERCVCTLRNLLTSGGGGSEALRGGSDG
jgi:hypothetical protein